MNHTRSKGFILKMPISYYLFGLAQQIVGVGLRTGRVFSVIMAFLAILTYGGITTRLRGKWAGLLIMLAFVINPSLVHNCPITLDERD